MCFYDTGKEDSGLSVFKQLDFDSLRKTLKHCYDT